jgi:hypothetical protein
MRASTTRTIRAKSFYFFDNDAEPFGRLAVCDTQHACKEQDVQA